MMNRKFLALFPIGKQGPTVYWESRRMKKKATPALGDTMMQETPDRRSHLVPNLALAAAAIGVLAGTPVSAAKRCDWHGPRSSGESTYNKCVDYAAMQGKSVVLYENATRISQDGISF